jgi:hypothetical protein
VRESLDSLFSFVEEFRLRPLVFMEMHSIRFCKSFSWFVDLAPSTRDDLFYCVAERPIS